MIFRQSSARLFLCNGDAYIHTVYGDERIVPPGGLADGLKLCLSGETLLYEVSGPMLLASR